MPKLPHYYTGTGDLCSALILGWSLKHPKDIQLACEKAISGIRAVIQNTSKFQETTTNPIALKHPELRLIQSKNEIENPKITLHATSIPIN